ncbi:hypothetical protein niasHS_000956 [Heterodera schachtii]|uniref:Ribophorin II C-terminal domain-containing protein n=1 Tax=Heterodera schachtii TaxID=97005 RepID=A0ABD2K7Z7_HETSC
MSPKSSHVNYDLLPEISHTFRSPEPRPSVLVSDMFSVLCASPLIILFLLWLRIGINFGKFKFSLSALGFHLGLCAVFGLYVFFWLELNMFQTLKWLAVIGVPTLFLGSRLSF